MNKGEVYFIAASEKDSPALIIEKLQRLLRASRIPDFIKKDQRVALKVHFGEKDNKGYVDPRYVAVVSKSIQALGAKPFLTDTNTLYKGQRANAIDHIKLALEHGFGYEVTAAPILIADGLAGDSYTEVDIKGRFVKTAYIASDIFRAEAILGISHFKGHMMTGFGGALKNLGMGCAARRGKLFQHCGMSPFVVKHKCIACGRCVETCPVEATRLVNNKSKISAKICIGCGACISACPNSAIDVQWEEGADTIQEKMVEYAKAALYGKHNGKHTKAAFINFAMKITKECDCLAKDDPRICPDVGIFTSTDPVSLDQACVDKVMEISGRDVFREVHPARDWSKQLNHAAKIKLGNLDYELKEIK